MHSNGRGPGMKRRCKAHDRSGVQCGNPPMKGQMVCRMHGGSTPGGLATGRRVQAEAQMGATLGRLGYRPVSDPLTALADVAGEIMAWKDLAAAHVARLQEMARDNEISGSEEVRASITVFERAMDRAASTLVAIAKLNIDERLARISEQRAAAMAEVFRRAMADPVLGLNPEQRAAAVPVIRRYLNKAS